MCEQGIVTGAATVLSVTLKKHSVIQMMIFVHTINGIIKIKISTCLK